MKVITVILIVFSTVSSCFSQDLTKLYEDEKYEAITNIYSSKKHLTPNENYIVGCAYLVQSEQKKAIGFFNKVLKSFEDDNNDLSFTMDTGYLYFCKGLALNQLGRRDDALYTLSQSLKFDSQNQMYLGEQAYTYYCNFNYDSALITATKAIALDYKTDLPYYLVPHIYFKKRQYDKAIRYYKESLKTLPIESEYYYNALNEYGWIQLEVKQNYKEAKKLFMESISIKPQSYYLYPQLIKSCYAMNDFACGDSIFKVLNTAFNRGWLYDEMDQFKRAEVDIIHTSDVKIVINKSFIEPGLKNPLKYYIQVFKKNNDLARLLTIEEKENEFYILKYQNSGIKHQYPYEIDINNYKDIKKKIHLVLNEENIQ